ncbi:DUF3570 domain-containing protein [Moritella viscosa]|uniref:DUF3570 domain-containing protein n=1 Tax=Moritella viscosa TaxID=80854 RepID=A0ABY1H8W5_9GAMM|nr:DUF3570 domain-containing protein [Moritella viscosa]SGY86079.1 Putative uncharacterized protein [Moritella viscosa]SGY89470.1 Putative uncharacterized protein [Moritella viscosa]SHO24885.1 Putative uncharacterized protein [Moritella viscosa]
MQLKRNSTIFTNISITLAAATCVLSAPVTAQPSEFDSWDVDAGLLIYAESDHQVQAYEGALSFTKQIDDERSINLKGIIDVLTGASPNGAVVQNKAQTFTRPSGNGNYTTAAADTPLDDTFHDTRVALSTQYQQQLSRLWLYSGGVYLSKEYDYLALSINSALARDFNKRNTTASFGFAYAYDTIDPEGGIPNPGVSVDDPNNRLTDSDTKQTLDFLFGLTQVIDRQTLMQLNYSISDVNGYQTDPFKILSVVDSNGWANDYVYENRPDQRTKQSLFWRTKYNIQPSGQVLDVSYRYFWDDWGITSHTIDSKWRVQLLNQYFIEPHLRYYSQQAVDFYRVYLDEGQPIPEYMTADYRLGELQTYTIGLKYGFPIAGNEFSVRLEYYLTQVSGDDSLAKGTGMAGLDLYPDKSAIILQSFYRF